MSAGEIHVSFLSPPPNTLIFCDLRDKSAQNATPSGTHRVAMPVTNDETLRLTHLRFTVNSPADLDHFKGPPCGWRLDRPATAPADRDRRVRLEQLPPAGRSSGFAEVRATAAFRGP